MILRTVRVPDELWPASTDIAVVRTFMARFAEGLLDGTGLPAVPPREAPIEAYRPADGTIVRGYRRL